MNARPMGFGRGRGVSGKKKGDLFKNVDQSAPSGFGGSNNASSANNGFGGQPNGNSNGNSNGGGGWGQSNDNNTNSFGGGGGGSSNFGGGGSSNFGGGGGGDGCRKCGESGHWARECPNGASAGGGGGDGCRKCGESGHWARECPSGGGGGGDSGCRICKEDGHFARDCPNKGEEKCFRCQEPGHRAADCTNEDTRERDPNQPAPVNYVPETDHSENSLFANQMQQGINFNKYDKIPVKLTGPGEESIQIIKMFTDLTLGDQLQRNIARSGYQKPTPVQKYALPCIVAGRDVMACAQTGSGKTAAFVLPMIKVINESGPSSSQFSQTQSPDAMVITPTRELAIQIQKETAKFSFNTMCKAQVAYGGVQVNHQRNQIRNGCNILIGTPGRLKQFVNEGLISLAHLKFLVLDEADRMLDMGFKDDIEFFSRHQDTPDKTQRQTLLFSATFPQEVQQIAKEFLKHDYLFITVGVVGAAQTDVTQHFREVPYREKTNTVKEVLQEIGQKGKVLIFVKTKKQADFLATLLSQEDFGATSIHGDRLQREREMALKDFTVGSHPILVATSVAARGLDIPGITHVINYDMPDEVEEYVHRIGRTGRAGNIGTSISFFDPDKDSDLARNLVKILSDAQQDVPDWLEQIANGMGTAGTGGWNNRSNGFGGSDMRDGGNHNGGGGGGGSNNWNTNTGPAEDELW